MEGLAQQMGQQAPQVSVEQVIQMLMEGIEPEQLVQQGIPVEVIQQAIEVIMAQEKQQQTAQAPAQTETGLAMMQAGKRGI